MNWDAQESPGNYREIQEYLTGREVSHATRSMKIRRAKPESPVVVLPPWFVSSVPLVPCLGSTQSMNLPKASTIEITRRISMDWNLQELYSYLLNQYLH